MAEMPREHTAGNPEVHHEESDVNIRGVFGFAAWLFVGIVAVALACWLLFRYFENREAQTGSLRDFPLAAGRTNVLPAPRLQATPRDDLREFRRQEDALLNGYSWVDRDSGTVRIPIAEAMRLTLERGLPVRESSADAVTPTSASTGGAR
jgi:hypothetical protein